MGNGEDRVFVGARPPGAFGTNAESAFIRESVLHQPDPDFSATILTTGTMHVRTAVVDGDANRADELRHTGFLVVTTGWKRELLSMNRGSHQNHRCSGHHETAHRESPF